MPDKTTRINLYRQNHVNHKGRFQKGWTCSVHQIHYASAFPHRLTPIITSSINAHQSLLPYFMTQWASLSDTPCPFSILAKQLFRSHLLSSRCAELHDSDLQFSSFCKDPKQATQHKHFLCLSRIKIFDLQIWVHENTWDGPSHTRRFKLQPQLFMARLALCDFT